MDFDAITSVTERAALFEAFTPVFDDTEQESIIDDTISRGDQVQDEHGCYPLTRCPTRTCSTCAVSATQIKALLASNEDLRKRLQDSEISAREARSLIASNEQLSAHNSSFTTKAKALTADNKNLKDLLADAEDLGGFNHGKARKFYDYVEKYKEINGEMAKSHAQLKMQNRQLRVAKGLVVESKKVTWFQIVVLGVIVVWAAWDLGALLVNL